MRRCLRQFIHALSHLVRLSPPMPMSAKPPTGTRIVIVTMIFGISVSGSSARQRKRIGMHSSTVSTALRISNTPNSLPASVKFTGISTRIEVEFTDESLPFTDVRRSDWFYEDVAFAYENGLFAGTSDTTFSPNASMTRAMLVTVLYRLEGQPAVNGRSGFSDVQYNGYYEDAVTWAADNGIVNGTSTTTFSPNANVTREQMAAILYRYAQYKKYNTAASSGLNGFTDHASVSGYAAASLEWAVAEKLVNGSAGKLMPTGNATRAQVAAILHRFVENVAKTTK